MIDLIEQTAQAAAKGEGARIVAKMNTLTDEPLIRALLAAGQKGVKIDLIVRGACTLPAGVPGVSDHIRVRSIIGRFLEHSRVFYFRMGKEEQLYLSSADWMNRNMLRRIELAWPVTDPVLRQRLIDECLVAYQLDDRDAWELQASGRYERVQPTVWPGKSAQEALMRKFGSLVPVGDAGKGAASKGAQWT
jgi:polyphosphate kinase